MVGQHSWLDPQMARVINDVRDQRRRHSPEEISHAYFRDKCLHAAATVQPALRSAAVIADRYLVSDAVYQEVLYGIPAEETLDRHHAARTLLPTMTIYIDVATNEAYRRVRARRKQTRHYERPAEMRAIRRTYQRVLADAPAPWLPPLVQFVNDRPDLVQRVKSELFPAIQAVLSSAPISVGRI